MYYYILAEDGWDVRLSYDGSWVTWFEREEDARSYVARRNQEYRLYDFDAFAAQEAQYEARLDFGRYS